MKITQNNTHGDNFANVNGEDVELFQTKGVPTNKEEKNYICLNTRHRETGLDFPCERCELFSSTNTTLWEDRLDKLLSELGSGKILSLKDFIAHERKLAQDEIIKNIGMLRQWLNEKPKDMLVTNEQIKHWLTLSDNQE